MKKHSLKKPATIMALLALCFLTVGCQDYLVFSTATKFGLDISQDAGQPPKMLVGYKRAEVAIIPAEKENATGIPATAGQLSQDTYSVFAEVCIKAPGLLTINDPLKIRSTFATGVAARTTQKPQGPPQCP